MKSYILIETFKFQPLEGEDKELINEGMYGKSLCQYLSRLLKGKNYKIPYYGNEDWGWWITIGGLPISLGLLIYCEHPEGKKIDKWIINTSINGGLKWSWTKFKRVNTDEIVNKLINDLTMIFKSDIDINNVSLHDDFPL